MGDYESNSNGSNNSQREPKNNDYSWDSGYSFYTKKDYDAERQGYYNDKETLCHHVNSLKKEEGTVNFKKLYAIKAFEWFSAHDMKPLQHHEYTIVLIPRIKIEYYMQVPRVFTGYEDEKSCDLKSIEFDGEEYDALLKSIKEIDFSLWNESAEETFGWCTNPTSMRFEFIDEDGIWCHTSWTNDGNTFCYPDFDEFRSILHTIRAKAKFDLNVWGTE